MLEAKDQENRRKSFQKKGLQKLFSGDLKKTVFKILFQAISRRGTQKRSLQIFREVFGFFQQNFRGSKNSAVLEPRTG